MKIPYKGDPSRFAGQGSARLLSAESAVAKAITEALKRHYGGDLPRGHCIVCVYLGNLGVPFVDIGKYTITTLDKLRTAIGQSYDIENNPEGATMLQNPPEADQEKLPL
jgi:hypothetical protein